MPKKKPVKKTEQLLVVCGQDLETHTFNNMRDVSEFLTDNYDMDTLEHFGDQDGKVLNCAASHDHSVQAVVFRVKDLKGVVLDVDTHVEFIEEIDD